MAVNKNAILRYQVLDRCFRNPGRKYTIDDLLENCNNALCELNPESGGVRKRQLYNDISFMESEQGWSIPLLRIKSEDQKHPKVYLKYEDQSFSINNQPLNQSEAYQLNSALQVLSRFTGSPQFEWINEITSILEDKFGLRSKQNEVISFDSNIDLVGLSYIKPIFTAITNQTVLSISYRDFKSAEPYFITFHPYYLRQYNNRWFAFGLNSEKKHAIWNIALDRIQSIQELNADYIESDNDWDEYFYDIIGVTKPEGKPVEKIILRFNSEQAPYILTKPLHPTQKKKDLVNGVEVSIEVIQNYELERLILSFGERVKVIAPADLRERITIYLRDALEQY
jgi:predicted DNA-binding transcriptional regulator YafY